jgi:hypothetical protein
MSYSASLSESGKFIICMPDGPITLDVAKKFALEAYHLSCNTGVKRFFADFRNTPNVLSVSQNYDFAYKVMQTLHIQRDIRAAILISRTDKTRDFTETVLRNAGYNVRLFQDEEAAIAWLLEGNPANN